MICSSARTPSENRSGNPQGTRAQCEVDIGRVDRVCHSQMEILGLCLELLVSSQLVRAAHDPSPT